MPRPFFHLATVFAAILLAQAALAAGHGKTSEDRPLLVNGILIPDVAGLPFSATVVIEFEREFPEGYEETRRTINIIARDSIGRTHNETRRFMPENFHGSPPVIGVRLFDPRGNLRTVYDPAVRVARQTTAKPREQSSIANPAAQTQDLGTSIMNGLKAHGTRHTYKLSARASGIGEAIEVEDEEWYSEELHLNLLVRHVDPRLGTQTVGISGLKREEPPASLFEVPAGFRILDDTEAATSADRNAQEKPELEPQD